MFRLPTATAIAFVMALPAFADVIDAKSTIAEATIFPQGASVVRTLDFAAEAGQHSIVVDDLPLQFDPRTLRVTGAGDEAFRIVSVDHRIVRLPPVDPQDSPEYEALQTQIDAFEQRIEAAMFERQTVMARVEVAEGRLRMVETLMTREPQDMVDDVDRGGDPADWAATIEVLAQQMDIALVARLEAQADIRPIDDRIEELRAEISVKRQEQTALQLPAPERSVATIEIISEGPLNGTLDLTYRVANAGWEPVYDLRLEQGAEAALEIERHARIWQVTGEAWEDVALTLSTARPSGQMAAPTVTALVAELWDEQAETFLNQTRQTVLEDLESDALGGAALSPAAPMSRTVEAGVLRVQAETRGQTVIYSLPTLTDVDGDGTVRQAVIDQDTISVVPQARSAPRLDPNAYLYAALTNEFDGPILPGSASIYVDGAYLGDAGLPFVPAGADVTLPFGVIDGISISSDVIGRESGDYGILSTTNTREETYVLGAESVLPYDIELTIYDRAPVSEDEDLEISVTSSIEPSVANVDGQRGVMAWTFDLEARASREITFGYEMWWPGDEQLVLQ